MEQSQSSTVVLKVGRDSFDEGEERALGRGTFGRRGQRICEERSHLGRDNVRQSSVQRRAAARPRAGLRPARAPHAADADLQAGHGARAGRHLCRGHGGGLRLPTGAIFDTRSVVLSMGTLFYGTIPGAIAGRHRRRLSREPGRSARRHGRVGHRHVGPHRGSLAALAKMARRNPSVLELYLFGLTVHVVMLVLTSRCRTPLRRSA